MRVFNKAAVKFYDLSHQISRAQYHIIHRKRWGEMTLKDTGGQACLQVKAVSAVWHLADIVKSSAWTPTDHLSEFEPTFPSGSDCSIPAKGLFDGHICYQPSTTEWSAINHSSVHPSIHPAYVGTSLMGQNSTERLYINASLSKPTNRNYLINIAPDIYAGLGSQPFLFLVAPEQVVAWYVDRCFLQPRLRSCT